MKKKKKIIGKLINIIKNIMLLIIVFTKFSFCTTDKKQNKNPYTHIDFNQAKKHDGNLYDFVDSIQYTFLEYDTTNLVGDIKNFKISKNYIGVVDKQNKLLLFSKTGKILSTIFPKGEGPEEYNAIEDFIIDSSEKFITILDASRGNILKYDITGAYISSHRIKYTHASYISEVNENYAIYQSARFSPDNISIYILNKDLRPVDSIKAPIGQFLKEIPYLLHTHWYTHNEKTYYKEYLVDTLFTFSKDNKLVPHIVFELGSKRMPNEYYSKTALYQQHAHRYQQMGDITESTYYIFIETVYGNDKNYFIYDKINQTLFDLGPDGLSTFRNNMFLSFWPRNIHNDTILKFIDSQELNQRLSLNTSEETKSIRKKLSENDNPVLIQGKLRPK